MLKKILSIAAIAVAAIACNTLQPQDDIVYHPTEPKGEFDLIYVTLPQHITTAQTKGELENTEAGFLCPKFSGDDAIRIIGTQEQVFTLKEKVGESSAYFQGKSVPGKKFTIIYPSSYASVDEIKAQDFGDQKQVGNDNADHIKYFAWIEGANTYEEVVFASDWAASKGGVFHQSGCIKVMATVPENVTSVSKASIELDGAVYSVELEGVTLSESHSFTAYIQIAEDIAFTEKQKVKFSVIDQDGNEVSKTFEPGPQTIYAGEVTDFIIGGNWPTQFKGGQGSPSDPYQITSPEEMCAVRTLLEEGVITCFKLMNDIDMSSVTDWTPINLVNGELGIDFNGNGHTISGLSIPSGSWSSVFGVLHGSVRDLTFSNCSLTSSYNAPCGIVCAWAGNSDGSLGATIENVHVTNSTVTYTGTSDTVVGGFCGNACNSHFTDCSFEGVLKRNTGTSLTTYVGTGGLIGRVLSGVTLKDCYTSGEVYCGKGRATGGLVGYYTVNANPGDITGCHTSATVTSVNDCTGGLIGWFAGGEFKGNWAENAIVTAGKYNDTGAYSYVGGLMGHSSTAITIEDCHFTGKISCTGTLAGGIVGQIPKGTTIRKCWFDGEISSSSGYVGGITSRTGTVEGGSLICDCYSKGKLSGTSYIAGIIGDCYQDDTIENCWSGCEILGQFGLGGLIARASNASASSVLMGGKNFNIGVKNCIAWNTSIKTTTAAKESGSNHYSAGPVVGYTAEKNTMQNCWRKADMVFDYYSNSAYNSLYDQEDTDSGHPLYRKYSDATQDKYYFPYNGKAAGASESLSELAKRIGWSESTWDLTSKEPILK